MLKVLLNTVWVLVVLAGLVIVVCWFEQYGIWGLGAIAIGLAMLVVFAAVHLGRRGPAGKALTRASDYAIAALIVGAIVVLAVSLVAALRNASVLASVVFLVFLVIFVGIFRDYLRRLSRRQQRKQKTKPD